MLQTKWIYRQAFCDDEVLRTSQLKLDWSKHMERTCCKASCLWTDFIHAIHLRMHLVLKWPQVVESSHAPICTSSLFWFAAKLLSFFWSQLAAVRFLLSSCSHLFRCFYNGVAMCSVVERTERSSVANSKSSRCGWIVVQGMLATYDIDSLDLLYIIK